MNLPSVFLSTPCLTEKSNPIDENELVKKWFKGSDKRYIDRSIQDFIRLNATLFDFLCIKPIITSSHNNLELSFRSGNFIGAIPLKSPVTGKPFADFIVFPRYLSDSKNNANEYVEIIYLLQNNIAPDFFDSSELLTKNHVRPPIYYECIKFVDLLLLALKSNWVKFDSKEQHFSYPKGVINWNRYLETEWDPFHKLDFPCEINWLNKFHDGLKELLYVYKYSKEIINDHTTPIRIKTLLKKKFIILDKIISNIEPLKIKKIIIRNSDLTIIKKTKEQANLILRNENTYNQAWRVDFAEIFEKYIQYIFSRIAQKSGWASKSNSQFINIDHNTPPWGLKYFEPDFVIHKNNISIMVDAKYKSHFLNLNSNSTYLKDEHRSDLHQITAYCAFQKSERKLGFLCYPSDKVGYRRLEYRNNISSNNVIIYLFGIPISSSEIKRIQIEIEKIFFDIIKIEKLVT